ncbi:hypothetical protein RR46_08221 [Papilio xuthus]|uniref:Uncharacterized protein n=1 Tax=Papilio xuthus TaxID=66420 RepID=A0A194QAG5_PAPXU|nr:hypothetical protein RR46_08221 [Papilio xuthus]
MHNYIMLLAHAFVKRETEAATPKNDWLEDLQNQFQTAIKNVQDKAAETFKPDEIQKNLKAIVDTFEKTINDLKANTEKKN